MLSNIAMGGAASERSDRGIMTQQKKHNEFVLDTSDQAREAGGISSATVITALASFVALIFSGISLYQTVLKRAEVRVFVPETVSYTRDPNGSFEVLAVPVTVINSGARDGVVVAMQLKIKNQATGYERSLSANYFAEAGYFSTKEDYRAGISRPKRPFAPLTIPGRTGHSATVLFYPREYNEKRVIAGAGMFSFHLSWQTLAVDPIPFLSSAGSDKPKPLEFAAELPAVSRFFPGQMLSGKSVRLFVAAKAK